MNFTNKIIASAICFISLSALAVDTVDTDFYTPKKFCTTAVHAFGSNNPVFISISYTNWAQFNVAESDGSQTLGTALVMNAFENSKTSRMTNIDTCAAKDSTKIADFTLYVYPTVISLSQKISNLSIEYRALISTLGTETKKVLVTRDAQFKPKCVLNMTQNLNKYFFDGFSSDQLEAGEDGSPKSAKLVVELEKAKPLREKFAKSADSFCSQLDDQIYHSIEEQYSDEI